MPLKNFAPSLPLSGLQPPKQRRTHATNRRAAEQPATSGNNTLKPIKCRVAERSAPRVRLAGYKSHDLQELNAARFVGPSIENNLENNKSLENIFF